MDLQETFFNVGLLDVPHPATKQSSKYRYVMNHDTDEILSIVTKDYQLIKNDELVDAIYPTILAQGGKLEDVELFGNGARTQYRWRFPNHAVTINEDEDLIPEIVIKNSYDGSTAITVMAGAFRMVCSNGMVVGTIVDYFKNRHLTDIDITKLAKIINSTIIKTKKYLTENVAKLSKIKPVKERDIIKMIELFPEKMMEYTMQYIIANKPKTYWDLLNVTTYIATHKMNRDAESTHNLEKKFLPTIMKMAKLK